MLYWDRDTLTDEKASFDVNPIAVNTWDGLAVPVLQAEPEDIQISLRDIHSTILAASAKPVLKLIILGFLNLSLSIPLILQ